MSFTKLEVGKKFNLIRDEKAYKRLKHDGVTFELLPEGGYALIIHIANPTKKEIEKVKNEKYRINLLEDMDGRFILPLVKIGSLIFEINFDPTLYEKKESNLNNPKNLIKKSNILQVFLVDSSNLELKAIKTMNIPMKAFQKMVKIWGHAFDIENYSKKYSDWVNEQERFSVKQLWEFSHNYGKIGVEEDSLEAIKVKQSIFDENKEKSYENETNLSLLEKYDKKSKEVWESLVNKDKITKRLTPKEFMEAMSIEEQRVKSILTESDILRTATLNLPEGGLVNYFIVQDFAAGEICEKCKSVGVVLLIMDEDYLSGLYDKKVFIPSIETYHSLGVMPNSLDFAKYSPIPINYRTDYWYCPFCKELHCFSYDNELGLMFNQQVIKI